MGDDLFPFFRALLEVGEKRGTGRVTIEMTGTCLLSLLVKEGVLLKVSGQLPLKFFVKTGELLKTEGPSPFRPYADALRVEEEDVLLALEFLDAGGSREELWYAIAHQASLALSTPLPSVPGVKKRAVFYTISPWPEVLDDVGAGFYLNRETMLLFQKARNSSFTRRLGNQVENWKGEGEEAWGEEWVDAFD